ncbi:MAG: hypothetical protein WKF80_02265 [Thermomicrobiales bacterium]
MTAAALVFDVLVLAIIACFVPLGMWRGGAREACVTAGVGLGVGVALEVAAGWGRSLAGVVSLDAGNAAVVVAVAVLWSCAVMVGYGGAAVVEGGRRRALPSRMVGGVLAGINGASLAGWSLTFVWRFGLDADPTRLGGLGPVTAGLMRHSDWLLVFSVVSLGAAITGGLVWRGAARPAAWDEFVGGDPAGDGRGVAGRSALPPRLPRSADRGKVEPRPDEGPDWSAFRPLIPSPPARAARRSGDSGPADTGSLPGAERRPSPDDDAPWGSGQTRQGDGDPGPRSQPWATTDPPSPPPARPAASPRGSDRPPERPVTTPGRPLSRPGQEVVSEWLRRGTADEPRAPGSPPAGPDDTRPAREGKTPGDTPSATFPWLIERRDDPPR